MLIERRKHKRFLTQDKAFTVFRPDYTKLGKIKSISMGGLSFEYIAYEKQLNEASEMDIFISEEGGLHLSKIPCKIINDFKIDESQILAHRLETRRCRLQFGKLPEEQADKLRFFLKSHTIKEA